jgi:hypothetical protein
MPLTPKIKDTNNGEGVDADIHPLILVEEENKDLIN